jgi:hypothetical protein
VTLFPHFFPARGTEELRADRARAGRRHDSQYKLTLQAETLPVSGAKLPPAEEKDRDALEDRVSHLRHLLQTLDLLSDAFLQRRLGKGWGEELAHMRRWLHGEERALVAA